MSARPHQLAVLVAVAALTTPSVAHSQVPVPPSWLGTWALNLAKSSYDPGPAPYRRATYAIALVGDGLKVTYDMVLPRGGVNHVEWTGKLDGRDYPVQGVGEPITYAYRPLPDGSVEVLVKVDGRSTAHSIVTMSADGRTMTTVTSGTDARGRPVRTSTVYERIT